MIVAGADDLLLPESTERKEAIRSAKALLKLLLAGLPVRLEPLLSMPKETAMPSPHSLLP